MSNESRSGLPRWTRTIPANNGFHTPTCDLCHWVGMPRYTETAARKACRDHARGKGHAEDATMISRAALVRGGRDGW